VITIVTLLLLFFITPTQVYAEVKLKVAVVNPSQTSAQTTPVRFDLPKGITQEHIIDIGDLELMYDLGTQGYYVHKQITLEPGEKRVLEVRLEDIWLISDEEIRFLETHSRELLDELYGTKHYKVGNTLFKKITGRLQKISKEQKDPGLSAKAKINLYYENLQVIDEIKNDIGMFENLVLDIGAVVDERVDIPETMAISLGKAKEDLGPEDIVELKIRISNPSEKRKQITPVKYLLPGKPGEVTPRHVVDSDGLDIAYEFNKECFYLYKDAVELDPSETKAFIVQIRDIWKIPALELSTLRSHTNNLILLLKGTEDYSQAEPLADRVYLNLGEITEKQTLEVEIGEHIAYYRDNNITLGETKKLVAQLEKLISHSGVSPGVTIEEAERLEGGGPESKRARGYKGIMLIAKSIFKGKAPTPATTWKIIFTILVFVAALGAAFFGLWYKQARKMEDILQKQPETPKEKKPEAKEEPQVEIKKETQEDTRENSQ